MEGLLKVPPPVNEPVRNYAPGSPERALLQAELRRMSDTRLEVPMVIGGKPVKGSELRPLGCPHNKKLQLGSYHWGSATDVQTAIETALKVKADWAGLPYGARAAVFLKAADLLSSRYRAVLNAATMLGQSKTAQQAEIDSACEFIDFLRFNAKFGETLLEQQPISAPGTWNQLDYRPIDGFVLAITPFNFTAIAGNLPTAPALMGNVVIWKPSLSQLFSAHYTMELLKEAGLPDGVINLVTGDPAETTEAAVSHPEFGGLHFTGSTSVFKALWRSIGENIDRYRQYPRIVGETGGKDFIFIHPSASRVDELATAIVRGAFEYQGQKCSAASRVYVPQSLWKKLESPLLTLTNQIRMGDVADFTHFMGAVINEAAYKRISDRIERAKQDSGIKVLAGGECSETEGWFIRPTVLRVDSPTHPLMKDELFGPVVAIYVYEDSKLEETLELCDKTTAYALTGAIFADDRKEIERLSGKLRFSAGNFYINDKPTGAVVGQQPFGGGRASGTNDKAGSVLNLIRWTSPRSVKESFVLPSTPWYPHQDT